MHVLLASVNKYPTKLIAINWEKGCLVFWEHNALIRAAHGEQYAALRFVLRILKKITLKLK